MARSPSCLISLFLIAGCAHSPTYQNVWDDKVGIATSAANYSAIADTDDGDANPKKYRDLFCSGQKPRRKISTSIIAVLPRPAAGVPIDLAQKQQVEYGRRLRKSIDNFFYVASKRIGSCIHEQAYHPAFCSTGLSENELIALASAPLPESTNITFVFSTDGGKIYAMPNKAVPAYVRDSRAIRELRFSQNKIAESALITERFTMVAPKEAAKTIFDGAVPTTLRTMYRDDGSLLLGEAVRLRDDVWREFISKMTHVKEAPSSDGRRLNLEVSLDLSLFCEHGRLVDDLTTK